MELEFAIRQTHVHELNKNDMKLELASYHESTNPGPDLQVQSTAVRSVDSYHGVYYYSKRGKTDGHSKRYKDPPIPRRLVGESHIPPGVSPAYTGPSENVLTFRLAGEHRKVGAGTQASFQLRRLPI